MTAAMALRVTAISGFLAVCLGAFGAHGLHDTLTQNGRVATWETAVLYHLVHTVVMLFLTQRTPFKACQWWTFLAGILIFSGTLYVLALTNIKWLGAITPIGGVCFLVGWGLLAFQKEKPC